MKQLILAAALMAGWTFASSVPGVAAAKTYDCSKPGNANKAACKKAAKAPAVAAKPAKTARPSSKAATPARKVSERKYDCSKAGNSNKRECKASAVSNQTTSRPLPAPKSAAAKVRAAPPATMASASKKSDDHNPVGAIAQCRDGTYSHAKSHSGACSHHGGVAKWL